MAGSMITVIDPFTTGYIPQFYGVRASTLSNILLRMVPTKISYGNIPDGRKIFTVEGRVYNTTAFLDVDSLYINPSPALNEIMRNMDSYGIDTPAANINTVWSCTLEQKLPNSDNAVNGIVDAGIVTVTSDRDAWPVISVFGDGLPILMYIYATTVA